jgi:hypothetical protein
MSVDAAREARVSRRASRSETGTVVPERARDAGTFQLIHPNGNWLVAGDTNNGFGWTLDDIESFLDDYEERRA